ncbi:MAG: alpha/beta family hydrolase [Pseudomonadota bacterium]
MNTIALRSGRVAEIAVSYPTGQPRCVLSWAAGRGGDEESYQPLADAMTARGIAFVRCNFADSRENDPSERDRINWPQRIEDFEEIVERSPEYLGLKIARLPFAVGGHSWGAQMALQQSAATYITDDGRNLMGYLGSQCAVVWSPQGRDEGTNTTDQTWSTIATPVLYVTGTEDTGDRTGDDADWRLEPFERGSTKPRGLAVGEGIDHQIAGLTGRGELDAEAAEAIADLCAAFVLRYCDGSWRTRAAWWLQRMRPSRVFSRLEWVK